MSEFQSFTELENTIYIYANLPIIEYSTVAKSILPLLQNVNREIGDALDKQQMNISAEYMRKLSECADSTGVFYINVFNDLNFKITVEKYKSKKETKSFLEFLGLKKSKNDTKQD